MVKCSECGFLTLRNMETGELDEVDSSFREGGYLPHRMRDVQVSQTTIQDIRKPHLPTPICFARSYDLHEGLRHLSIKSDHWPPEVVLEVFDKERDCEDKGAYAEWQRGFTPKEHREMLDRDRQREYEESLRRETWAREDRRDDRVALDRRIGIIVAGAFGLLGAAVGALIVVLSQ